MNLDGRMMDFPLTITHILEHGRSIFPHVEVVTRRADKSLIRQTYAQTYERAEKLARGLTKLGVKKGDRVATFCWNHREHLECYLGVPSMGAVVHTLNLRLHPDELTYIANHAEDSIVVVDRTLWPLFDKFRTRLNTVKHVIVVRDDGGPLPEGTIDYEALVGAETAAKHGPSTVIPKGSPLHHPEERSAAMICYTSGTTGNPKGVVYTHRSSVLHSFAEAMVDTAAISANDTVLPVVPMFHAAAWGLTYTAFMVGSKIVLPGPHLDPVSLLDLMATEKVTLAGGVPTIWMGILGQLDANPKKWDLSSIRSMMIGGSAAPPSLISGFQDRHNLDVVHAWGMTETNPLGTLARATPAICARGKEATFRARASQGLPAPFVELRVVDDAGNELPWDGESMGELEVRGPWVSSSYLGDEGTDRFTADGWFKTGDVSTIDADGYMRITDRSKDVIKSGGEWISSVGLENALMSHPAVQEAAVFGVPHPTWDERPIAAVVLKPGHTTTHDALVAHLAPSFAKMSLPDATVFIAQIPRTSTGKFLKSKLRHDYREMFAGPSAPK